MKYVVALTIQTSDLRKAQALWRASGDTRNPFAHVLVSPLFARAATLRFIREELKDRQGGEIFFDSGGYAVQQGRIRYNDLYAPLLECYRRERWADCYVLPDCVPLSRDDPASVESKLQANWITQHRFYEDLPEEMRRRALPVIHGRNIEQVTESLEHLLPLAGTRLGFGSFATAGKASTINMVTDETLALARAVITTGGSRGKLVHLFGVGSPPLLPIFYAMGAGSLDTMGWLKAAIYGNVFLTFVRGFPVSTRLLARSGMNAERFAELKALTRHSCPFCASFARLSADRMQRALHNLAVLLDTVESLESRRYTDAQIMQIVTHSSPRYLRYYLTTRWQEVV